MKYVNPLDEHEIVTLSEMHDHHPLRRARMRAHSILLSHQGVSIPEITRIYQIDRRQVSIWIDRWHSEGLVGLYDRPGPGRRAILNAQEQQRVQHYLEQYPKDLKRVVHEIEQETQKRVSTKTIKRIIKKNAMAGNESANHQKKSLSQRNMNASRL